MKKTYITIVALAAISGAAYAAGDSELRDSDTYFGKYSTQLKNKAIKKTTTVVSPLAIGENARIDQFRAHDEDFQENLIKATAVVVYNLPMEAGFAARPFCLKDNCRPGGHSKYCEVSIFLDLVYI